jgi:hypothetical protein
MSWNGGAYGADTVSERSAALRQRAEAERLNALQNRGENDMPKSKTGVKRVKLRTDEAQQAVGDLNQKLDDALDVVREAMLRERDREAAERSERADEANRATALRGRS